jgi:transposase-like protein
MFKNLHELIATMPDEKSCRDYLIKERWNGVPVCHYCESEKSYLIEDGKRFKCGSCLKKYSVTVGTIFHASNIKLNKWLTAIYLITAHKKGISSYQLGRDLGVSQKTGWFMLHRIREMLRMKQSVKLDNVVEVDEVYIGGKVANMSKAKRKQAKEEGTKFSAKTMVMGLLERSGDLKLIPVGKGSDVSAIPPIVKNNVEENAVIITDSSSAYLGLEKAYAGHEVVNHSANEYVREGNIHTNSIEGAFSLLKRSIIGIYHQVTPKHLSRYCDETMFRYNLRKMKDSERFTFSLSMIEGRLTYKSLVQTNTDMFTTSDNRLENQSNYVKGKRRPVIQLKNGEVIAQYNSVAEAAKGTGIIASSISRVLKGWRMKAHGYEFKYL